VYKKANNPVLFLLDKDYEYFILVDCFLLWVY